ncbi:ABC transporter permease [Nesterenkonia populi]
MSENTADRQNPDRQMADLAEVEDAKLSSRTGRSYSQGQLVLRRFVRHVPAMISLGVLLATTLLAFTSMGLGPLPGWWPESYRHQEGLTPYNGGDMTMFGDDGILGPHPFGQDDLNRDYFARVMQSTQTSLIIALVVGVVSSVIGVVVGAMAGFYRGWVEAVLMRATDFVIIVPPIMISAILGRIVTNLPFGIFFLALMLGLVTWTSMARLVRAEVLALREREFIAAATAMGASPVRIILKHMVPNSIGVIIVNMSFAIASAVLLESALSYLGMGVQSPDVSLGMLVNQNEGAMRGRPHLFWLPAMFIVIVALCVNFIGDGLRDAFDPRRQRTGDRKPTLLKALGFMGRSRAEDRQQKAADVTASTGEGGRS